MGQVEQKPADQSVVTSTGHVFSTDPPYYDNVPSADLPDFFYVWLRRSLGIVYPDLFGTMLVPKAQELIADPFRHGGQEASRRFFEDGMKCVFANMRQSANPDYPVTVYYAFKQAEQDDEVVIADAPTAKGKTKALTYLTKHG
jgi:putative DNA methylase